jgi:hypothetical protein
VRFSQPLAMEKATFGDALAPAAAVPTDGLSPSNNPMWEGSVFWVVGTSLDSNGG